MAKRDRLTIHTWDGVTVIDIGAMDIWDGCDLALLRETLVELIERQGRPAVGVNMSHVKYIPSGFFGMLFDWHERGTAIRLYSPQPNVARMLWFRQFFKPVGDDCYLLVSEPMESLVAAEQTGWIDEADWDDLDDPQSVVAFSGREKTFPNFSTNRE